VDKRRIVEETCREGASVSGVARKYGIGTRLLFSWKQELAPAAKTETTFLPVTITDAPEQSAETPASLTGAHRNGPGGPPWPVEPNAIGPEKISGINEISWSRPTSRLDSLMRLDLANLPSDTSAGGRIRTWSTTW